MLAVVIGGWRIGKGFALFALLATLYIIYSGYSEHAAITLALTLSSTFFSLLLGIPLGIWSAPPPWVAWCERCSILCRPCPRLYT